MRLWFTPIALAVTVLLAPALAFGNINVGETAPPFTKDALDAPPPAARSLTDYPGKVIVLFLFGYNCPYCLSDGPSVEADIRQYYDGLYPGRVQVLGADMFNGTQAQVRSFRTQTGATFPLLLQGASSTGGNLNTLYGPFDNYLVIGVDGLVKYHSANLHPHGDRYYLSEIRGAVNQELTTGVGVPDQEGAIPGFVVSASPNPFTAATTVEFVNPTTESLAAHVTAHDPLGRLVAAVWSGTAEPGRHSLRWGGAGGTSRRLPPGVYFLRVQLGPYATTHRVTLLP